MTLSKYLVVQLTSPVRLNSNQNIITKAKMEQCSPFLAFVIIGVES